MKNESILVTKPFMPPRKEYDAYLDKIFSSRVLTNNGPLIRKLEKKLEKYLDSGFLYFIANGTLSLQIALKALKIEGGEVITTPFSFVASTTSILWQGCNPIFVDVNEGDFNIDANLIEKSITEKTRAILAVHVFGYPCDVDKIEAIASKYDLKVIYDGAHAFGVRYKNKSLMSYGDVCTASFHATKLFHTIEGGACITNNKDVAKKISLIRQFGYDDSNYVCQGINAKASEFNAAMGLANYRYVDRIIEERGQLTALYNSLIDSDIKRQVPNFSFDYNYAYYPILFKNEEELMKVCKILNDNDVYPRRYFYPSLNKLSYLVKRQVCPVAEDISSRVVCLPLYNGLGRETVEKICKIISINTK
ncbi:MAG: DegT/DnrJ/EryC1/StrS family aminotransferase [Rickettsiales bacterium]|jgi:dTDP-4-amino-4,6-dideoxygalactose transaminase|nr:DegT/DnrJ/EryC1/StrS family aminotransferase [Rickettsiales bacterium]